MKKGLKQKGLVGIIYEIAKKNWVQNLQKVARKTRSIINENNNQQNT